MMVKFCCKTNGRGLWSDEAKTVNITELEVGYHDPDSGFGELRASFDDTWSTREHGLIYTDPLWMKEFRGQLEKLGFSKAAARSVEYSEQGMQSRDYVSMDFGQAFSKEWLARGTH